MHCTTWTTSTTDVYTVVVDVSAYTWPDYIVSDTCQPECIWSFWLYEEINGIPGLQRGDEWRDDTCHGMIESDLWLW